MENVTIFDVINHYPYLTATVIILALLIVVIPAALVIFRTGISWKGNIMIPSKAEREKYRDVVQDYEELKIQMKYWVKPDYISKIEGGPHVGYLVQEPMITFFGKAWTSDTHYKMLLKAQSAWEDQRICNLSESSIPSDLSGVVENKLAETIGDPEDNNFRIPKLMLMCNQNQETFVKNWLSHYIENDRVEIKVVRKEGI